MATVVMNLNQYAREQRKLAKNFLPTVLRGMRSGALRALPYLHTETKTAVPASINGEEGAVNTGDYLRRWKTSPIPRGVRIFNDSPYASIIERGRRRGTFPNITAIERWARRRLQLTPDEAREAAFPIARAIAKRGLKPRRVLAGAEPAITQLIVEEVGRELTRAMRGGP